MLHTRFRGNQPAGSIEEVFGRVFPNIMGVVAILFM